jgi:hypothetical protein
MQTCRSLLALIFCAKPNPDVSTAMSLLSFAELQAKKTTDTELPNGVAAFCKRFDHIRLLWDGQSDEV